MIQKLRTYLRFAATLIAIGSSIPSVAEKPSTSSAFNISPLRLELAADQSATRMLVRNESNKALAVQVRIFRWEQSDGKDVYSLSHEVLVSPSIIKIDAERTQVFHLVGPEKKEKRGEQRYRVVVDELPGQSRAGAGMAKTRLRMTVPLFINSESVAPARLSFRITENGLAVRNDGGRTARLSALFFKNEDGSSEKLPIKGPKYVVGGSEILLPLPSQFSCRAGSRLISGFVDKKKFDATPAQNCT